MLRNPLSLCRRQALIVYMLEKYTKKQRKEISTLNHAVTEISKDNDAFLTEIEEKSLEMLLVLL